MKKIALFVVALIFVATANAQLVVGLQGGYYSQKSVNSWNDDHNYVQTWLGGGQIGFQITSKLYFGVMGGYINSSTDDFITDSTWSESGMTHTFTNIEYARERTGWMVAPELRYELFKYGNMHFNIMLQGNIRNMGPTTTVHSYNDYRNNHEYIEDDPTCDSLSNFTWSVSLRPTLTYEFSKHLSAELSLDFLSVGYMVDRQTDKLHTHVLEGENTPDVLTTTTLYAGLNTLKETLRWENPMLRLGFNYTF